MACPWRVVNVKDTICDANNLYEAYLKTIKGSKWKETTQKFALNYLRQIFKLLDELRDMRYLPGEEGEFTLNERGKIRPITTLQPRDRVVRHVLCDEVLMPAVYPKLIYDNGASIRGRGMSHSRSRFEVHLHKYYEETGSNEGYILFGDFKKFYDNIIHELAKNQLLELFEYDEYLDWLLTVIFENFEQDVSYMSDEEFEHCIEDIFNKLDYRDIPKEFKTGKKFMAKSCNIGDQLSQIVGVFYPNKIDTYVKFVRSIKYYGRYMDDFYIMSSSKEELLDILDNIVAIAAELGIHLNMKKTHIVKMSSTYKYLQVKYILTDTGHIIKRINPKRVTKMRRKLKDLAPQVESGETKYDAVEEMFRSWMGSFYKVMSKKQRTGLLKLYEDLYHKKILLVKQSGKWKMIFLPKEVYDGRSKQSRKHSPINNRREGVHWNPALESGEATYAGSRID